MLKSMRKSKNRYFLPLFGFPWGRPWGNHAKCCVDGKGIRCLQIVSCHVPIYLQQFPSYSNRKCKKAPFSRTFHVHHAHIFISPEDAPCDYHAIIFNSFRVIRCLSQCVSPKIAIFTTFLFPLGTHLGQSR